MVRGVLSREPYTSGRHGEGGMGQGCGTFFGVRGVVRGVEGVGGQTFWLPVSVNRGGAPTKNKWLLRGPKLAAQTQQGTTS